MTESGNLNLIHVDFWFYENEANSLFFHFYSFGYDRVLSRKIQSNHISRMFKTFLLIRSFHWMSRDQYENGENVHPYFLWMDLTVFIKINRGDKKYKKQLSIYPFQKTDPTWHTFNIVINSKNDKSNHLKITSFYQIQNRLTILLILPLKTLYRYYCATVSVGRKRAVLWDTIHP